MLMMLFLKGILGPGIFQDLGQLGGFFFLNEGKITRSYSLWLQLIYSHPGERLSFRSIIPGIMSRI